MMSRGEYIMKFELDVVKFEADVVVTSASSCAQPGMLVDECPFGG